MTKKYIAKNGFNNEDQYIEKKVLIVEDDESAREILKEAVIVASKSINNNQHRKKLKFIPFLVPNAEKAESILAKTDIDLMLLDLMLPNKNGIELLADLGNKHLDIDVVIVTARKDAKTAVMAMKYGVLDYITKDFDFKDITELIKDILLKQNNTKSTSVKNSEKICDCKSSSFMVESKCPKILDVYNTVNKVCKFKTNILIEGESGTGKELFAAEIHNLSGARNAPFIAFNIASVPDGLIESFLFGHEKGAFTGAHKQQKGKFELANGGTLFLDEIGDLKYDLQVKLLRVIQEGEFERVGGQESIKTNLRLIFASNKNLEKMVSEGTFREDLFYRINTIPVKLPPLRERKEDIPKLCAFFIKKFNKKFNKNISSLSNDAQIALKTYNWPGNIRELENLIERLVALSERDEISRADIPLNYQLPSTTILDFDKDLERNNGFHLKGACDDFERKFILHVMELSDWNRNDAAKMLGIPISTLKYKLNKKDIYKILHANGK